MKKLFSLILTGCFLIQFVLPLNVTAVTTNEPAKDDSIKYYRVVDDAKDEYGNNIPMYMVDEDGNIVEDTPYSDTETIVEQSNLPTKYDLRNYGYVTPVKHQGGVGACNVFAMISSLESSMIKQGYATKNNTDYSEAHLLWFTHRQRSKDKNDPLYDEGVNVKDVFNTAVSEYRMAQTLLKGSGLQLEENAPWTVTWDQSVMKKMEPPESTRYNCHARLYSLDDIATSTAAKQSLINNGNLVLGYYASDNSAMNNSNHCYYQNKMRGSNHAVAVVGWDDNYPRTNFNSSMRPKNNGAWLIKNSWGTNYANQGYFWLSYEDTSISSMYSVKAAKKNVYDNIYQYDGGLLGGLSSSKKSTISTANRFKAQRNELLTHVSFCYLGNDPVTVKIEIYRSDKGYKVPTSKDPTENMTLLDSSTTAVTVSDTAYRTIQLDNPVLLEKGEYFTVKLTYTNTTGNEVIVPIESSYSSKDEFDYYGNAGSNPGESFLFTQTWENSCNFPIKAMTKNLSSKLSLGDVTIRYKGECKLQPEPVLTPGVGCYYQFTSEDPSIVTVDLGGKVVSQRGGTVQQNAGGSTRVTCTAFFDDGSVAKATCTVTVEYTWWQWILRILSFGLY